MDAKQLEALVSAAVKEAVQRTAQELTATFERETQGLRQNRDTLLREKKSLEGKSIIVPFGASTEERTRLQAEAEAKGVPIEYAEYDHEKGRLLLAAADRVIGVDKDTKGFQTADRLVFKRGLAHEEYKRLKALATERGVQLVVEGDEPPERQTSRVKYVETDDVFFANKAFQQRVGVMRLQAMAQERGKNLVLFRDPNDLPKEAAAKHSRIVAAGDPEDMVFEEGE